MIMSSERLSRLKGVKFRSRSLVDGHVTECAITIQRTCNEIEYGLASRMEVC